MRTAFHQTLLELARKNDRIFLTIADLGYGAIEPFAEAFPERYYNCGVAEQNMHGIACGLALEGKIAVTYSISNFPTLRCLEQIRNDACYHNANVKIVSTGGGLGYGHLGMSHHATEDIAILRSLPNMAVAAPCDRKEAICLTRAMIERDGPFYLRCGLRGENDVHGGDAELVFGKAQEIYPGSDATVIFSGTIGYNAKIAAEKLRAEGISIRLLSMHTISPIDRGAIVSAAEETGNIITVEEHNLNGGLGSAVAEALIDAGMGGVKFKRIGLPNVNVDYVGSKATLRDLYGLSADKLYGAFKAQL